MLPKSRIESLRLIETAYWRELERAAQERGHGWRTMTLATVEGQEAHARSVTLREVAVSQQRVLFYTDDRSPKLSQLQRHPVGTLLAWCPALSWQLRLRVHLSQEQDASLVKARWSRLRLTPAAQDYLSPMAPGEPLERADCERGSREHFAIVNAQVLSVDWLELHPEGHRRAVFGPGGPQWVQP
jgi:pyridoxamine 5'-phosphate oxidase